MKRLPPEPVGTRRCTMAIPAVAVPTVVAFARSFSAATKTSAGPPVASSVRRTVRPFQTLSPVASSGFRGTLRLTMRAIGPRPTKSVAEGATSTTSPPIEPRRSSTSLSIERRSASSIAFRSASAVDAVKTGILTIARSFSHFVSSGGGVNRSRRSRTVTFLSSTTRKRPTSTVVPSGPSRAEVIFHSGALRRFFPSTA